MGKNEVEVSRTLSALQVFKLSQPIPAVLSLVRAYRDNIIKYSKLRDALQSIEHFHFAFTAITSSRSSGGISAMYSSFARSLFAAKSSQAASTEIRRLAKKLHDRRPSLEEFTVAFKEIYYTNSNSKQKNLVRYILRKVSEFYSYKYPVDFDELTIEHIQPQSKSNEAGWTEVDVGRLGNLLFVDQETNGELDTKSFCDKVELLKSKGYSVPTTLLAKSDWTSSNVNERTEEMAQVAYNEIWKI